MDTVYLIDGTYYPSEPRLLAVTDTFEIDGLTYGYVAVAGIRPGRALVRRVENYGVDWFEVQAEEYNRIAGKLIHTPLSTGRQEEIDGKAGYPTSSGLKMVSSRFLR